MLLHPHEDEIDRMLMALTEEIGVPESRYDEAKTHYSAVGNWLDAPNSSLKPFRPEIYPQGSFAIGTAIRPINDEEYDVDTVCVLKYTHSAITQQALKAMVGNRLKEHAKYCTMIDPKDGGRRCWTLRYADGSQFHLDILPAIPDSPARAISLGVPAVLAESALKITDKTTWNYNNDWPKSNPRGYARWFTFQMQTVIEQAKKARAGRINASVADIQDYEVRTPLQRAVQLLKRHRDVRYVGDDDRPISIIISTLAARSYRNETTLFATLRAIIPKMRTALNEGQRDNDWWVPNPVNPEENFADKWKETPRKAELFLEWLNTVEHEFSYLLSEQGFQDIGDYLTKAYGARDASQAMKRYAESLKTRGLLVQTSSASKGLPPSVRDLVSFDVPHRQEPTWPLALYGTVEITAEWRVAGPWKRLQGALTNVPTKGTIQFHASTNVAKPYSVHWQVVNTGADARKAYGLRGTIFPSHNYAEPLEHSEKTLYRGRHWVECFIVKNDTCVARSGPFVVNIV